MKNYIVLLYNSDLQTQIIGDANAEPLTEAAAKALAASYEKKLPHLRAFAAPIVKTVIVNTPVRIN